MKVCERGTSFQLKIYERGIFSGDITDGRTHNYIVCFYLLPFAYG